MSSPLSRPAAAGDVPRSARVGRLLAGVFEWLGERGIDAADCDPLNELYVELAARCAVHPSAEPFADVDPEAGCRFCREDAEDRSRARRKPAPRAEPAPAKEATAPPRIFLVGPEGASVVDVGIDVGIDLGGVEDAPPADDDRVDALAFAVAATTVPGPDVVARHFAPPRRTAPTPSEGTPAMGSLPKAAATPKLTEKQIAKARQFGKTLRFWLSHDDPLVADQRQRVCAGCIAPADKRIGGWRTPGGARCARCGRSFLEGSVVVVMGARPATPPPELSRRKCGRCGERGHNSRSCERSPAK